MYFNAEAQANVIRRFHFALSHPGYLFLGKAEMLLNHAERFAPVDLRNRLFRKTSSALLEPRGAPGWPDVTGAETPARIEQVTVERRPVELLDVEWQRAPGVEPVYFNVLITPLFDRRTGLIGVGVHFADVTRYRHLRQELEHAHQDLERAYEELQSTNEELETTNEELQSTNEELETTNEELQSTVEELETMNEELQSTNDELQDINSELRTRSAELDRVNGFLEAVLGSLGSAVVVVDGGQLGQAWSPGAEELWGPRADEVLGVHLLTLDIGLPVDAIAPTVRRLLGSSPSPERVELDAVNRRGRPLRLRVSALPLRGSDGEGNGGILVMEPVPGPTAEDGAGS